MDITFIVLYVRDAIWYGKVNGTIDLSLNISFIHRSHTGLE